MKTTSHSHRTSCSAVTLTALALGLAPAALPADPAPLPFPRITRFENFRMEQGMPCHKIHGVLKASDGRVWVGTWEGLLVRDNKGFHPITTADGLSHKMVLSLSEDTSTGDIWVGTMRGLNRVSGGKVKAYLQTDSGLPNNVVYGVDVIGDHVWVATAAGTGDLNTRTGVWQIYDHNNAAMHEPWCYSIKGAGSLVYIGVWGGGIVEHNPARGTFKEYRDPDADFHYDLVPDDGPVNDITSWLTWDDGILWQCTYFGFSRFDGRRWRTWVESKSPLPSNFTQFVFSHRKVAWIGTDKGLSTTDGETWVNYSVGDKGSGLMEIHRPGQAVETLSTDTALAHGFVLGVWVDDQEAWIATSDGLSRGILSGGKRPDMVAFQPPPHTPKPSTDFHPNNITAP